MFGLPLILLLTLALVLVVPRLRARRDFERVGEAARALGLEAADRRGHAFRGVVGELELVMRFEKAPPRGYVHVTITCPSRPLAALSIESLPDKGPRRYDYLTASTAPEPWIPDELRPPIQAVETQDAAFDLAFVLSGDEDEALALLDGQLRRRLLRTIRGRDLSLTDRTLHVGIALDPQMTAKWLESSIRSTFDLARSLASVPPADRPARLLDNARSDLDLGARLRNLEVLLDRYPDTDQARDAKKSALESDDPDLWLVVALASEEGGIPTLEKVAACTMASEWTRATAMVELAFQAPSAHRELFLRALDEPSEIMQTAAIGALNMLDFESIPLAEVLDRLDELGSPKEPRSQDRGPEGPPKGTRSQDRGPGPEGGQAFVAALRMLARVSEEGAAIDAELRARIVSELSARGALEHAEEGTLALVDKAEGGALSLHDRSGALSFEDRKERS